VQISEGDALGQTREDVENSLRDLGEVVGDDGASEKLRDKTGRGGSESMARGLPQNEHRRNRMRGARDDVAFPWPGRPISHEAGLRFTNGDPLVGKKDRPIGREKPGERRLPVTRVPGEDETPAAEGGSAGVEKERSSTCERRNKEELIERIGKLPGPRLGRIERTPGLLREEDLGP
jgi:hypothetical protein